MQLIEGQPQAEKGSKIVFACSGRHVTVFTWGSAPRDASRLHFLEPLFQIVAKTNRSRCQALRESDRFCKVFCATSALIPHRKRLR